MYVNYVRTFEIITLYSHQAHRKGPALAGLNRVVWLQPYKYAHAQMSNYRK